MNLTPYEQIFDIIGKAKKVLIILPKTLDEDTLSSGLALKKFLQKLEKEAQIYSSGILPKHLLFLPDADSVQSQLPNSQSFMISVNVSEKKVSEISYQTKNNQLNIFLKPKGEMFTPADISFNSERFPADALVFLGCKSQEDVGELFLHAPDLFFETAKINIDYQVGNEYFGNLNLVDVTATSTAEILTSVFEKYETQLVDADIATCLLVGIIAKTHSFQHVNTTPRAFLHASNLIGLGGRQQEIIKNIFKTKSLQNLKLWGKALSKLKILQDKSAVYSTLAFDDLKNSENAYESLNFVLIEILENVGGYDTVGIMAETEAGKIEMLLALHVAKDATALINAHHAQLLPQKIHGYNLVYFKNFSSTFVEAETKFIGSI
jgi:nanoRNase/pAp phosphatase (c-di-AMP/oligoRNAs hydrolase)